MMRNYGFGRSAALVTMLIMAGCASMEIAQTPAIPKVTPPAASPEKADQPSPPALPAPPPEAKPADAEKAPEVLHLTVEGALVLALEHNQNLAVESVNPALRETYIAEARAEFDPILTANYSKTNNRVVTDAYQRKTLELPDNIGLDDPAYWAPVSATAKTDTDTGEAGLTQHLPTGADITMSVSKTRTRLHRLSSDRSVTNLVDTETDTPSVALTVSQSLLRGAGLKVNLASLRQARIGRKLTEYEMRAVAEDLVAQTEQAYWDYVLAQQKIDIYQKAMEVARSQQELVAAQIGVGRLSESERSSADAELASRESALIDAKSTLAKTRLVLLRLLNPSPDALASTAVTTQSDPILPEISRDTVETSVALARRMRPEINQARLQLQIDQLEVVKTKNGLLPQLDLFLQLARDSSDTEYARSFVVSPQEEEETRYNTQVGLQFAYPIGNRAARARDQRARMTEEQDRLALANMAQLIEQDVRTAYVEIDRSWAQIDATAATLAHQEKTEEVETEKFKVGRSNTLLVAQAQRDLLTAQINQVQARIGYLKAIVDLYRLEGTLLERRGIQCPGGEPVLTAADKSL